MSIGANGIGYFSAISGTNSVTKARPLPALRICMVLTQYGFFPVFYTLIRDLAVHDHIFISASRIGPAQYAVQTWHDFS